MSVKTTTMTDREVVENLAITLAEAICYDTLQAELKGLREAAQSALPLVEILQKEHRRIGGNGAYAGQVADQLRAALHPQPEEGDEQT